MKNLLNIFLFLFASHALIAQVETELTIENQSVVGTELFFDIFLRRTASNPGSGELYLGNADFILTFNSGNFTSPVISKNPTASPGGCSFVPTDPSGLNPVFTQDLYFQNTAVSISGAEIRINLNGPTPGDQMAFDTRVARINNTVSTHKLGGYKISGITSPGGTAGLMWKTSGMGVNTQVQTLENTAPFNSSGATVIATNPPNQPLPVALAHISATPNDQSILVSWKSESEINLSGFELQRSTDGSDFSKIAFINATGDERTYTEYQYDDTEIKPGITYYYRLKMLDNDGSFSFSPVRSAKVEGKALDQLAISPNPAKDFAYIDFEAPKEGSYTLELFNEKGGSIFRKNYDLTEGANSILLNTGRFSTGTYLVKIKAGEEIISGKLIRAGE